MEHMVYRLCPLHLCHWQDFGLDDNKVYPSPLRLRNHNDNDNAAFRDI